MVVALIPAGIILVDTFWDAFDRTPLHGAKASSNGRFSDGYEKVRYLDQGWTWQSSWFYRVNQGSDLLPYDFFLSLSSAGSSELFRSDDNVSRWRYLPQAASSWNPDALPVGFAKDTYKGREYVGLTCAACHTGQVNYRGVAIRIDGGPSLADMQSFINDLGSSLDATATVDAEGKCVGDVCKQFVSRVLALGHYEDELAITRDLVASQQRIATDRMANQSDVAYGYGRLDAFGRIFNRVLDGILRKEDLDDILPDAYDAATLPAVKQALAPVLNGTREDSVMERALALLTPQQQQDLVKKVFNSSSAPVSYPFLWDTPEHDFVQWNGIVANAELGPLGRNSGEVIGVFGTLDWSVQPGSTFWSWISGQRWGHEHVSYESSIYVHNLRRIEARLATLRSPRYDDAAAVFAEPDLFPPVHDDRALLGKALFAKHCAGCHAGITRDDPNRRVVANMTGLDGIGTDRAMADNSVNDAGYSGMLRDQYVGMGVGNILLDRRAPVAALLTTVGRGVVSEPYPNANVFRRAADWLDDLAISYFSNQIQPSIKNGNYDPDTTAKPFASLGAYKGRSLNGIWATAPYLHNGSVPNLYDILLPKRRDGDPEGEEYRPDKFRVGSREFDPVNVGYVSEGYDGFVFDTSQPGNSNAGHEYGTLHETTLDSKDPSRPKPLTKQERLDLLEYLKSL